MAEPHREPDYFISENGKNSDVRIEAEIARRKGLFVTDGLEQKQSELGAKEFEKQKSKLMKEFEQRWEQIQQANATIRELEEHSRFKITEWSPLEKAYRLKLEAEGYNKQIIENTLKHRRREFDRNQYNVKARLKPRTDPDQNFRRRVLDPATRNEALTYYLVNHVDKRHFLFEAIKLLFELNETKRR